MYVVNVFELGMFCVFQAVRCSLLGIVTTVWSNIWSHGRSSQKQRTQLCHLCESECVWLLVELHVCVFKSSILWSTGVEVMWHTSFRPVLDTAISLWHIGFRHVLGTAISLTFIESMSNKLCFKIMYAGYTSSKWSNSSSKPWPVCKAYPSYLQCSTSLHVEMND